MREQRHPRRFCRNLLMLKPRSLTTVSILSAAVLGIVLLSRADASAPLAAPQHAQSEAEHGSGHGHAALATSDKAKPSHAPSGAASHVPAAAAHGTGAEEPSADELWHALEEGNFRFVASAPKRREYHTRRAELAQSQHPAVMVLTCADSRVSPELVFDQTLGDLFVVRAAGNVADSFSVASLEYAAEHLGCRLLVIMGHERCGAVKAAASGDAMPTPSLQALVERIRPAFERVPATELDSPHLLDLQIEANVKQSSLDVLSQSPVLLEKLSSGELSLVKCVYDLDSGEVQRLY
jgi:carbonic anhydrase